MDGTGWIGHWSPGIGDPSAMGWVTVAAYFATSWACWRARARAHESAADGDAPPAARIWLAFCLALAALGVNKQLDLQSAITALGKMMAKEQGWYSERDRVQLAFILIVLLTTGAACAWMIRAAREDLGRLVPAVIGGVVLLVFVSIRASSFHWMDAFIGYELLGLRMNWIMELGGIALIAFGAVRYRPAEPDHAVAERHP